MQKKTKHDPLTAEEMAAYRPSPEIIRYIETGCAERQRTIDGLRILDWGSGRGRLVAYLRDLGAECFGVDPDESTIGQAQDYFASRGWQSERILRPIREDNRTDFPDEFFDVVVSDNVMEHVASPVRAISEIARVTHRGGWGFHLLPAPHTVMEGHLFMPFVHWLPKGPLRRGAIGLCVRLGMEPRWHGTETLPPTEKTILYYQYSQDKTFYRSQRKIRRIFADAGLESQLVGINHPAVSKLLPTHNISGSLRNLINWLIAEIKVIELVTQRAK